MQQRRLKRDPEINRHVWQHAFAQGEAETIKTYPQHVPDFTSKGDVLAKQISKFRINGMVWFG